MDQEKKKRMFMYLAAAVVFMLLVGKGTSGMNESARPEDNASVESTQMSESGSQPQESEEAETAEE